MATFDRFDDTIKEYLLLKGYLHSYKAFDTDLKNEKDKGYKIDKIMDQIHQFVNTHDLNNLRETWNFLDERFFSRLDLTYAAAVRKLENSLMKHYVIHCVQSNRNEKVQEFFEKMSSEIQGQQEWREWFLLPYCKSPEDDRTFSMYCSKQWQDTLYLSLHNFLSVIMQSLPTPKGLTQDAEIRKIKKLEEENAKLRQQVKDYSERRELPPTPKNATQRQGNLSESILSPAGAMSGPTGMDLMDDFYVISQDTIIEDTPVKPKSQPAIKTLLGFGRSSPGTTRKQMDEKKIAPPSAKNGTKVPSPSVVKKTDPVSVNRSQSDPAKNAISAPKPPTMSSSPGQTKAIQKERPKSVEVQSNAKSVATANKPKEKKLDIPSSQKVTQPSQNNSSLQSQSSQSKDSVLTSSKDSVSSSLSEKVDQSSSNYTTCDILPVVTGTPQFSLLSQEEYSEHHSSITHCRFSGTGHSVATLDVDGVIKVWEPQPSPVTTATVMSKSMLQSIEWVGKTDQWLLLGSKAGSVRLFDINKKQIERETKNDNVYTRVSAMSCNPQGTRFVCATSGRKKSAVPELTTKGGKLTIWDIETMQTYKSLQLNNAPSAINCICHSDMGQMILTGGSDGIVRLYVPDGENGECLMQWQAHQGEVYSVAFANDTKSCFTMGADGKFMEWSLSKAGHQLSSLNVHLGAAGPFVLSGAAGYRQVQTAKGKLFAFDKDQRHVITCAGDSGCIYNVNQANGCKTTECVMLLKGHKTPVVSVDWSISTDTMLCLSASMDGKVRVSTLLAH